jgi:adenosylhomocysteine nucleosidase
MSVSSEAGANASRAPEARTAVVSAMPEETAAILAMAEIDERSTVDGCKLAVGRLGRTPIVVCQTGEGSERARAGLVTLLDRYPVDRMIVVGVAGALSPSLGPGSLIVARDLRDAAGPAPAPDPSLLERLSRRANVQAGTLLTTENMLCTRGEKSRALESLDGDGPAAVDLESSIYARVAAERAIPFVVLRAVSERAASTAVACSPGPCASRARSGCCGTCRSA